MNTRYSLPSEQIPNDGGYHLPRLIKEANDRLKAIGKHGKRATIKVTAKFNKPISAQFSLPNIGQKQYGLIGNKLRKSEKSQVRKQIVSNS